MELENTNPNVFGKLENRNITSTEEDDNVSDDIDSREVFGKKVIIRSRLITNMYLTYYYCFYYLQIVDYNQT